MKTTVQPEQPVIGMRDGIYRDSTPRLSVGNSSFEDWYQAHKKACTGDKQLARDAYAAGMGDPLVTYAHPAKLTADPDAHLKATAEDMKIYKDCAKSTQPEQPAVAYIQNLPDGRKRLFFNTAVTPIEQGDTPLHKAIAPPAVSKAVAYRYKFKGDLQWQYTETLAQATQPCEIQYLYIAQPEQPHNLQKRLADLHHYEEIAEHYAKCAVSPEALLVWVAEHMSNSTQAKAVPLTTYSLPDPDKKGLVVEPEGGWKPDPPHGWVLVPNKPATPTPDYKECARQATVATGLQTQYPSAWLSIFIREINRWCQHAAQPKQPTTKKTK